MWQSRTGQSQQLADRWALRFEPVAARAVGFEEALAEFVMEPSFHDQTQSCPIANLRSSSQACSHFVNIILPVAWLEE
jgi:hypothetical protein